MKVGGLANALRGIGGEFEINRLIGAIGAGFYILFAHLFVFWDVVIKGREFDIVAYCAAFPAGLGLAVAAVAGAVAIKDRNVATAKSTESKTKTDAAAAGDGGVQAIEQVKGEGAEQVSEAARDKKDEIKASAVPGTSPA